MINRLVSRTAFLMFVLLLLASCQGGADAQAEADGHDVVDDPAIEEPAVEKLQLDFLNAAERLPGVWTGGQPTREQLQAAAEAGVRTVVNMRVLDEEGAWDEREFVEGLGMKFIHIPVAGAPGITPENAELLAAITGDAQTHPLMAHCRSGKRVDALIALQEQQPQH